MHHRTRHHPSPDPVQLRRKNPPTSMIRLLPRVTVQQHAGEADLPQTDVTKPGIDARPWYVPVRSTERENEAQQAKNVHNKRRQ